MTASGQWQKVKRVLRRIAEYHVWLSSYKKMDLLKRKFDKEQFETARCYNWVGT